ncbi:MAG TPA: YlxR family protein [Jiangellaceae bacterium]|nr:YlxR family protein [Jiangellaceae bacterium]
MGCRVRTGKSDLLRVVAVADGTEARRARSLAPDRRGRLPGRGAYLHPDLRCLDLAERRRAFPRALRLTGPLDTSALRRWLEEQGAAGRVSGPVATGREDGDTT